MRRGRTALFGALLLGAACSDGAAPAAGGASGGDGGGAAAPFPRAFVETTARAGLRFRHDAGARGDKLLPETMGVAPVVFDYDGDGAQDVFLPNGGPVAASASRPAEGGSRLFRNRGDGTFEDVTARARCDLPGVCGMGGSAADYDGDGDDDLFVAALRGGVLLRNDAGVFVDATDAAGVRGGTWTDARGVAHPEWSTASAWFDADRDGDVDLFVAHYVAWTPETEVFTTLDGVSKSFATPDPYPGLPCRLFRNRGDGTFEDASADAGLLPHRGKALGVALWDFDGDGSFEVVVANDTRPNFLFLNRGDGTFVEAGLERGVAYDENGRARAGMGVDVADDRDDAARPVAAIGNFAGEPISFYRAGPDGRFTPTAADVGLAGPTFKPLTFGLLFFDADLDGRLDLALANGHLEPDVARSAPDQTYAQAPMLFRGAGGSYVDVTADLGPDFSRPRVGRGLSVADFDGDGALDLLLATNGVRPEHGAAALLMNRPRKDGDPAPHWLRVAVRGRAPNTRALGAKVELTAGGRTATRYVRTGSSYAGQSDVYPTFGLGAVARVDRLRVTFPRRGASAPVVRDVEVGAVDRTLVVEE